MTAAGIDLSPMKVQDYDEVAALWRATEGIGLNDETDSREGIASYLTRNPAISHVARHQGRIVGAVLCGHDGRRGYLHRLAVARPWRNRGIASALVEVCLAKLASIGIPKCNIFLFADNQLGRAFWNHVAWVERADLKVLQRKTSSGGHNGVDGL